MQKQLIFGIIRSLHDLFTALWIGGLLTTTITFMPAIKKSNLNFDLSKKIKKAYHNTLRIVVVISMIGLWVTGVLLSRQSAANAGFLNFSTAYNTLLSIKHLIVLVMVLIAIYRGFVLGRNIEQFSAREQKLYVVLIMINVILGVGVVFLSGIGSVLG